MNAWLGGGFMTPLLKRGQAITEANPREIVTKPRVMGGWKQIGIVEATSGDVDKANMVTVLVR